MTKQAHEYYFSICDGIAKNSKCYSRQIGAMIVQDELVVPGYNGPPRGVPPCDHFERIEAEDMVDAIMTYDEIHIGSEVEMLDNTGKCPRKILGYASGEGMALCTAAHAEVNAILNCARMGVITKGAWLYLNESIPCPRCASEIINAGISTVVYDESKHAYSGQLLSRWMFSMVNVKVIGIRRGDSNENSTE